MSGPAHALHSATRASYVERVRCTIASNWRICLKSELILSKHIVPILGEHHGMQQIQNAWGNSSCCCCHL